MLSEEFIHLHVRTEYSGIDSAIRIPDLVREVIDQGMNAVAVTDVMSVSGAVRFAVATELSGVQPIYGAEFLVEDDDPDSWERFGTPPHTIVLLAENLEGWRNLIQLVSHRGGYLSIDVLRAHSNGLIALSGGLQGQIASVLKRFGKTKAKQVLNKFRKIFPDGRFFIELQDGRLPEHHEMNMALLALARATGTPPVVTGECRPLYPKLSMDDPEWTGPRYPFRVTGDGGESRSEWGFGYLKSPGIMLGTWWDVAPDAVRNTRVIADRCQFRLELGNGNTVGDKRCLADRMTETFSRNLEQKYRLYADIVKYAIEHGIRIGPRRGKEFDDLLSFSPGSSASDSGEQGLQFDSEDRKKIVQYLKDRYGADRVFEIAEFDFRKCGDFFEEQASENFVEDPDSKEVEGDPAGDFWPQVVESPDRLKHRGPYVSSHPSAILISDRPLEGEIPLSRWMDGTARAEWDRESLEKLGMFVIDIYEG